jgi:hypothetical protein
MRIEFFTFQDKREVKKTEKKKKKSITKEEIDPCL